MERARKQWTKDTKYSEIVLNQAKLKETHHKCKIRKTNTN